MRQIERRYDEFFATAEEKDFTKDKQLTALMKWCFDNGFLDNLTEDEINDFLDKDNACLFDLPLLKQHGITIGVDVFDTYARVGIDPTEVFDKISKCSIVVRMPFTSKREQARFYKLLGTLLDRKSSVSKDWHKLAGGMWYGAYFSV